MVLRSSDPEPAAPRRLSLEEWVAGQWRDASLLKRRLIAQRCGDFWGALGEYDLGQLQAPESGGRSEPGQREARTGSRDAPALDPSCWDLLSGTEFERLIGEVFERKGYTVEYHGGPTESGGDLVCWERSPERVHAILVQVKRERCLTGTKAISQILRKENWFRHRYQGQTYEKWVITSSHFSRQAVEEARVGGITLLDREKLQEWSAGV